MNLARRSLMKFAVGAVAAPLASSVVRAQGYPARPITIIVPLAAGGPTDTIARIIGEGMRATLGQPVLVENSTGAEGIVGVGRAVRSAPDGYTLSIGQVATHALNAAVYSLKYDLIADFEPISLLVTAPVFIVTNNAVPAQNLKELIVWLKTNDSKATAGTFAVWNRLFGAYFQQVTGTRFPFVPYRGAAPAMQDLLAGQIDLMFDQAGDALPRLRTGMIKAYAIAAKDRIALAPDVPTMDEAGLAGFYLSVWHGLWAPKGTPRDVIARLNAAVVATLSDPSVRSRLAELGQELPPRDQQTPEYLRAFQKAEIDKWSPIIKVAGIKGE